MANEESKVISFPNQQGGDDTVELSADEKVIIANAETIDDEQTAFIGDVVTKACTLIDQEAEKSDKPLSYHVPIEVGIGVAATYLNMFTDQTGQSIETLLDEVQGLANALSNPIEKYFTENPEVPPVVYFYALLHSISASLRQQRFMINVEQAEAEYADSKNEAKGE